MKNYKNLDSASGLSSRRRGCGMTKTKWITGQARNDRKNKEYVIPVKTGIQKNWIPYQVRDDKSAGSPGDDRLRQFCNLGLE